MPTFSYEALDNTGGPKSGSITAENRVGALRQLKSGGVTPLRLEEIRETPVEAVPTPVFRTRERVRSGKIKTRDVMVFTHQLASLVGAGLPLLQALRLLKDQTENQKLRDIVTQVAIDVEGGSSFSNALGKYPRVFSRLYVSMIGVAETGGVLDKVLLQLADFIERGETFRTNILTAIIYPIFLLILAFTAVTFLMVFVVPTITGILLESGQSLPAPTLLLMKISAFLKSWGWLLVLVIAAAVWGFRRYRNTPKGRYQVDLFLMRTPLLGPMIEKSAIARFSRTLGTLTESGVPILHTLQIMGETVGNSVIGAEVDRIAEEVRKGEGLALPLKKSPAFPEMVAHLVAIGEESGQLEQMLFKIADAYDFEVSNAVKRFTSVLEPFLILFMALIVGFIVISMLLPILNITQGVAV